MKTKNVLICVRPGEYSEVCMGLVRATTKPKHKEMQKHADFKYSILVSISWPLSQSYLWYEIPGVELILKIETNVRHLDY